MIRNLKLLKSFQSFLNLRIRNTDNIPFYYLEVILLVHCVKAGLRQQKFDIMG